MSFSSTAKTTPYSAITTPTQTNSSTPGNTRASAYTAAFVAKAEECGARRRALGVGIREPRMQGRHGRVDREGEERSG